MPKQDYDPLLRQAIQEAAKRLVAQAGGQAQAAARLSPYLPKSDRRDPKAMQGKVSDMVNARRTVRLETVVALRYALREPLDQILQLPAIGSEPGEDASLDVVRAFFGKRWDGLGIDFDAFPAAAREGVPPGGWKRALDSMGATIAPERFGRAPLKGGSRPEAARKPRRNPPKNRGSR